MALTVGELAGFIDLDDSGFQSTSRDVERSFERMGREIEQGLRDSERDFDRWSQELGDAGRDAARELERQVERGLDGVEDAARDSGEGAGDNFGDGMGGAGDAQMGPMAGRWAALMQRAGPWLAAGAAIGGILMKALEGAMEKQDVAAKLSAQVGAFGPRSAELGDTAGELYAKGYGESLGEVGEALKGVIQNMGGMRDASKADLKEVAASAMTVAEVLDEDVGKVTRTVGQMIRTGMAKDAKEAFDILTTGAQRGGNAAEDLLDTFDEYSTQFRNMGLNGQQATGLLVQGLRAGARDADVVADTIKEFSIEAVAGADRVMGGFKSLGLNADEMSKSFAKGGPTATKALDTVFDRLRAIEDPVKRNQVAIELFGTKAEDMGRALFALDPSSAVQALGAVDNAAKKAGDTLHNTASNRLESFKRSMQQGLVDFVGGPVLGALESFATRAQTAISGWIKDNPEVVEQARKLGQDIQEVFQGIGDVITAIWDKIGPTVMAGIKILVTTIGGVLSGLIGIIKGIVNVIAGIFTGDWKRVWTGMQGIVRGGVKVVMSLVRGLVRSFVTILKNGVKLVGEAGKALIQGLWNGIKSLGGWIKGKFTALVKEVVPGPLKKVLGWNSPAKLTIAAGKDIMRGLWYGLKSEEAKKVKAEMAKTGKAILKSLAQGLKGSREESEIKAKMDKIADSIKKAFEKIAKKTKKDDRLLAATKATTKRLINLARERAKVMEKLADMREFRDKVRDSARSFASLTSLDMGDGPVTSAKIRSGLQGKVAQLKKFAGHIRQLMKRGLPKSLLRQILEAGPEAGADLAAALAGGSSGDLAAIASAQKEIDSLSSSLGTLGMEAAFGKGVYESLQKEKARIEKLMDNIARTFARQVANALTNAAGKNKIGVGKLDVEVRVVGAQGIVKSVRTQVRKSGGNVQKAMGKAK